MFAIVSALLRYLLSCLRPKHEIALENLALRHQIALLNRSAHKPRLRGKDRLFWVVWVAKTPCSFENLDVSTQSAEVDLAMLDVIFALLRALLSGFRPQSRLMLENLALRHQLAVLKRQTHKPKLRSADRLLWVCLRRLWPQWPHARVLFQPQTVIAWHRLGFRLFWRWKSRARDGRPSLDGDLIALIRQMWQANPTWGSPRIQAELAKLGIEISDSTIRKYRPEHRRSTSAQTWKTFLHNHTKELVAVDFFTVPTATFRVLYVFLVLAHERRKVLHFHITQAPSAAWAAQQMVEAFAFTTPPRYLLRDRDGLYGADFVRCVEGLEQKVIAPQSPWQNPMVERLIGSIRRECLDHVIVLSQPHLCRSLDRYFDYYHRDRAHRALDQDSPDSRPVEPPDQGNIVALPRLGGLHHRYTRQAASRCFSR
jgi:transposase InsO family protein